jgi:hypothetical protein
MIVTLLLVNAVIKRYAIQAGVSAPRIEFCGS